LPGDPRNHLHFPLVDLSAFIILAHPWEEALIRLQFGGFAEVQDSSNG
jgi:hypothetical protein